MAPITNHPSTIDRLEIARLTETYGGAWGINHTRRLLHLVELIGREQAYDEEIVWLAAHLHDWGAYSHWAQEGVDHAVRSTQVAETFLAELGYPADRARRVLECIATHHSCGPDRGLEAVLLSDADILDFLGVVGVLRDFSKNARDLRKAYGIVHGRRDRLPAMLCLASSRELAASRLQQMDELLARFEADSFGCF
jgi:uncharacterized protein